MVNRQKKGGIQKKLAYGYEQNQGDRACGGRGPCLCARKGQPPAGGAAEPATTKFSGNDRPVRRFEPDHLRYQHIKEMRAGFLWPP